MTAAPREASAALLELFAADASKAAAALERGIRLVAEGGAKPETVLAELLGAVHVLRSAARIVDVEPAARISAALERSLVRIEKKELLLDARVARALFGAAAALARIGSAGPAAIQDFGRNNAEYVANVVRGLQFDPDPPLAIAFDAQPRPAARAPSERPRLSLAPRPEPARAPGAPDPRLLELFKTEAANCAAEIAAGLVKVESGDSSVLEALMRAAHSFKGALRVVGFDSPARVAHALEDCFVAAQRGQIQLTEQHVDVLLKAADYFSELAECSAGALAAWQAAQAPRAEELTRGLSGLASGQAPTPSPAVLPPVAPLEQRAERSLSVRKEAARKEPEIAEPEERVLRVTAASINRLMGLAGESLVESRRAQSFASAMLRLKRRQAELAALLDRVERGAAGDVESGDVLLAEIKARAMECRNLTAEHVTELEAHARRGDDLSDRLYREALKSRMRPFRDGVTGLPRVVRDVARKLGKKARLEVFGENTDVDRDVLESLEAPLNHLLRNAVDHGIENPAERAVRGKPEQGLVRVEARHHAGLLAITVSDDGGGIDPERLRTKIIDRQLLRADVAARLSNAEVLEFIFLPGFSTASEVTEISGRGVGLDAVRTAVEAASGTVRVTSEPNRGTQFQLQLPVTRSVLRAVVAQVAGDPYAFPLLRIERILRVEASAVETIGNVEYIVVDGDNVALISAQQILGFGAGASVSDPMCVVVIGDRKRRYALVVDNFLGEHDLVVRPLDRRLGKVQDVAAAVILMDGSPALIVDVDDMLRSVEKLAQAGRIDRLAHVSGGTKQRKRILVVDDSITVREAERQLLVNRGYDVDVAVDGVDGWNTARDGSYDLLIVDIDMPRMNGIDLIRTIRQDSRYAALPIVIVSYKDRAEDRMRGLDAGANQYLTKSSFHDDTLVGVVEDLIGAADA